MKHETWMMFGAFGIIINFVLGIRGLFYFDDPINPFLGMGAIFLSVWLFFRIRKPLLKMFTHNQTNVVQEN